jgi:hypothetical protein
MTRTIPLTEVAGLIRNELKHFTDIKFSVRSKSYSGGSSIRIEWTDGPTVKEVEAIAGHFHGATFNSCEDLTERKISVLNGAQIIIR